MRSIDFLTPECPSVVDWFNESISMLVPYVRTTMRFVVSTPTLEPFRYPACLVLAKDHTWDRTAVKLVPRPPTNKKGNFGLCPCCIRIIRTDNFNNPSQHKCIKRNDVNTIDTSIKVICISCPRDDRCTLRLK